MGNLRHLLDNVVIGGRAAAPLGPISGFGSSSDNDGRSHLLVLLPSLTVGGAEYVVLDILRGLSESWRASIVTTSARDHELEAEFTQLTRDIHHLPNLAAPEHWLSFAVALARAHGSRALLSSNSLFAYENGARLKASRRELVWINLLHNALPSGHIRYAAVAPAIDFHVAVGHGVGQALAKWGVPPRRIATIPNGIDHDELFTPAFVDRKAARARLNVAGKSFVLAFVGRLSEEKRPLSFLRVAAKLAQRLDVHGLIVGTGPLEEAIEAGLSDLNLAQRVTRLKKLSRSEMPSVFAAADLLLITSAIEGLPLCALEALAMGCPVAATRVGDLARIIKHDETGFLVDVECPEAVSRYVAEFAVDPVRQARMRQAARSWMEASIYSKRSMLDGYKRLFAPLHVNSGGWRGSSRDGL
jgi:glycosyltransferase involved in cell wall biosynthesis